MGKVHAVLLAGTIRPSPLREALDIPVLALPVGAGGTLLDAWHRVLVDLDPATDLRVVVNSDRDVEIVAAAAESAAVASHGTGTIGILAEPAAWRGTAGLLRDVTDDLPADAHVIVAEARCLPPATLRPLAVALTSDDLGVVGVCGDDSPAGVYLFRRRALEMVAAVGYNDVKEQLLPALHGSGLRVCTAVLGPRVFRMRDRSAYLAAVAASLGAERPGQPAQRRAPDATIDPAAVLDEFCIIERGVTIGRGAVVHQSVILAGATIEADAVVSRSIVGPGATIAEGRRLIRAIEAGPAPIVAAEPRRRAIRATRPVQRGAA